MAMRHLRRIQEQVQQSKEPARQAEDESEEEQEEVDAAGGGRPPFNPFDLLSDEDEPSPEAEASGQEGDGQSDGEATAEKQRPKQQEQEQPTAKPAAASKKAAKKKKKKAKPGKQQAEAESDDEEGPAPTRGGKAKASAAVRSVEEDIDAIVRELNLTTVGPRSAAAASSSSPGGAARTSSSAPSVLCVDVKGLRGDEELRRIFGSDVVAAVDREDRAAAAEARRFGAATRGLGPGGAAGGGGRRRGLALKRGWLVAPKDNWPPCEGGLSMEMAGNKGGVPVFRYVHSPAYRETQARFYRCQASYDPGTIAALLQQAPYHVDSLLAMHDLYRHMGENSYAEEMLSRALWALEAAWHPAFQPATAACRLDYAVEENRPLFGALFRHVQALSRRGCHRAALECCKLLLALQPEDPLGALCLADYLAVRAGRYDWLQRFVLEFEGNRSLALLPNYAFALPMAAHRQQQEQQGQQGQGQQGTGSSKAGSASSSPHELLVGALLLHPLVLPRLLARLQDKGAAKESYWRDLQSRRLFREAGDGGNASLSHLVGLYVERSGELWKPPDLLALLRGAAQEAADVAEGKVAPSNGISAADWRTLARESFPPSAANEYRHLRISDFSDAVNALPREEVEAAVQAGAGGAMQDVEEALAELQEQMILAAQERQAAGGGAGGAAPMSDEELRGANPLLMLLRSMLPWVNAGQQPDYAAPQQPQGVAGQQGQGAAAGQQQQQRQVPAPEYDDDDGHLEDEDGMVRQVRR